MQVKALPLMSFEAMSKLPVLPESWFLQQVIKYTSIARLNHREHLEFPTMPRPQEPKGLSLN